jgi:Lysylphosphatidylglycerol synthase TM region
MRLIRSLFLLAGLALFVYLVFRLGPFHIVGVLQRLGWSFLLIPVVYGAHQLARAAALWNCLSESRPSSYWNVLWVRISGEALQVLPVTGPLLVEPTKALLLKNLGIRTEEAVAGVIAEYLVYTFTSASLAIYGLLYLVTQYELSGAILTVTSVLIGVMAVFLVASTAAVVFRLYLIGTIMKGVTRLPLMPKRFRPEPEAVRRIEDLLLIPLRERPKTLLRILVLELVAQAALIFELAWIMKSIGFSHSFLDPVIVEASTKFVSLAFFFVPAQLGAAEGTYTVLFEAMGLRGTAGFGVSLIRRLRTLLLAGAGLVSISFLTRRRAETNP